MTEESIEILDEEYEDVSRCIKSYGQHYVQVLDAFLKEHHLDGDVIMDYDGGTQGTLRIVTDDKFGTRMSYVCFEAYNPYDRYWIPRTFLSPPECPPVAKPSDYFDEILRTYKPA